MSDRLHIIITGDKSKARSFLLSKRKVRLTILLSVGLVLTLSIVSFQSIRLFSVNTDLDKQVAELSRQLQENNARKEQFAIRVNDLQQLNSSQAAAFEEEKATLLNDAVSELEERSNMIEQIMANIGLEVQKVEEDTSNSGGPYIAPRQSLGKELLFRSDHYLKTINYLPLGRPVPGPVTSRYGHRTDPLNGKKGFHSGVDFRGRNGQTIQATADGVVTKAFFNGSYGRYIEIDHGNGYSTKFAHMKKMLVKRGDKVKRGDAIGKVGSSGRSTGPHLHYEICLSGKPTNPSKFMRVDKLVLPPVIAELTAKSTKKLNKTLVAQRKTVSTVDSEM